MDDWLSSFAYRIPIGASPSLSAGIGGAIAWLTVSYHFVRAARFESVGFFTIMNSLEVLMLTGQTSNFKHQTIHIISENKIQTLHILLWCVFHDVRRCMIILCSICSSFSDAS